MSGIERTDLCHVSFQGQLDRICRLEHNIGIATAKTDSSAINTQKTEEGNYSTTVNSLDSFQNLP